MTWTIDPFDKIKIIKVSSLCCLSPSELDLNHPSQIYFIAWPSHKILYCSPLNEPRYFSLGSTNNCL